MSYDNCTIWPYVEDMRFDEFAEGLARVGWALKDKKNKKTMVEIFDEVVQQYLVMNEQNIKKMKNALR